MRRYIYVRLLWRFNGLGHRASIESTEYTAGGPFETPKSLNCPFSISNTHPWTQSDLGIVPVPVAQAATTGGALHRFSTCAFTFSSTRMERASEAVGVGIRLWTEEAREVSGVNQRPSGVSVVLVVGEAD